MGVEEGSPLLGRSDEGVPYVFMTNPKRAYNKRVRQLQCYLCSSILGVFLLALLVSVVYSLDKDQDDDVPINDTLALKLKAPAQDIYYETDRSTVQNGINTISKLHTKNKTGTSTPKNDSPIQQKLLVFHPCMDDGDIRVNCNKTKYRPVDGVCNNLNHPLTWGVSERPLKRFLPSDYCDGASSPKCASSKSELPSSHDVGLGINNIVKRNMKDNNMIIMLWAQFLYQDLVQLQSPGIDDADCCNQLKVDNTTCFPISIQKDDPNYSIYNTTCINYARSNSAFCNNGNRVQMNSATSFLDGSVLYGSSQDLEKKVRLFHKGQLALYLTPENKYLPIDINIEYECKISSNKNLKQCTNQGFSCISRDMGIPSINLMMTRQHNLIAGQLSKINPHWDDEMIFQNAKKIVIAQIQHITYNEFLEEAVGIDSVKTFGDTSVSGYFEEYNAEVDASISLAFVNSFQVLNSIVPENGNFSKENSESQSCNLYKLAQHVQQGRDHGIPGYTKLREACGLGKLLEFDGLTQTIGEDSVKSLERIYETVEDIDLAIGLLAEMKDKGNRFGPVGSCIVSEQFRRTKTGDRFWFESPQQPQALTRGQLAEIHKTTLSRIICDHSNISQVQYSSMKSTEDNPTLQCFTIPSLNVSVWDENIINPYPLVKIKGNNLSGFNEDTLVNVRSFMNSANDYILQSSKAKSNVTKRSTSFTVNILNATLKLDNEVVYEADSEKPPYTMPLDSVADQSSYNPSAYVSFSANYEEDILQGIVSLPLKNSDTFQKAKKTLELNFIAGISIKWGGSFTIDSKKSYHCKVMFQSFAKMSNSDSSVIKRETGETVSVKTDESGEQCNIMLIGTYYHRPFYCSVTPWWCLDGLIFYWSGEAKLIFVKPNPPVQSVSNLKNIQKLPVVLGKTDNEVVEKTFASVTVINCKISGQYNGEDVITLLEGGPPIDIPLDNFISPNSYDTSTTVTWSAMTHNDRTIVGEFSVPYFPSIGSTDINRRKLMSNFSVDVIYKYGGSIGIIVPGKTYTCKVMFQGNKKSSLDYQSQSVESIYASVKGKTPFGESCSITISGSFSDPSILCKLTPWWCKKEKIFHWSGDMELALKYKHLASYESKLIKNPQSERDTVPKKYKSLSDLKKNKSTLGKSDNSVVEKTFASVTVLKGDISGKFNGEEILNVMNGGPPIDIYLDGFAKPNSYETSLDATWTGSPIDDRSVIGTFSIPYIPSIENYSDRRMFTANFSVDVIYKYGGSIGIIDPSKTYTCKVMFQANKKSNMNTKLLYSVNTSVPLKQKTPYGESCSITLSGSFPGPSIFCYLTPWWCSKETIFSWNGDIELALKYKYNVSNPDVNDNTLKMLKQTQLHENQEIATSKKYPMNDQFCCGHRYSGKVLSGWLETKTGSLFSTSKTIWSGEIPFEIRLPLFWTPSNDYGSDLSNVYGHAILWSASIFHSTIQGSFSFPQYIGHGPPPSLKWINGKFLFQLEPNPYISLYDLIVPGVQYKSNLYFHNKNSNSTTFVTSKIGDPTYDEIGSGIRAPIILLGRHTQDKQFVWNGSFVIDLHRSAKDLYYG